MLTHEGGLVASAYFVVMEPTRADDSGALMGVLTHTSAGELTWMLTKRSMEERLALDMEAIGRSITKSKVKTGRGGRVEVRAALFLTAWRWRGEGGNSAAQSQAGGNTPGIGLAG